MLMHDNDNDSDSSSSIESDNLIYDGNDCAYHWVRNNDNSLLYTHHSKNCTTISYQSPFSSHSWDRDERFVRDSRMTMTCLLTMSNPQTLGLSSYFLSKSHFVDMCGTYCEPCSVKAMFVQQPILRNRAIHRWWLVGGATIHSIELLWTLNKIGPPFPQSSHTIGAFHGIGIRE